MTLNNLVASTPSTPNDWFVISPAAHVSTTSRGLQLIAPRGPRVLEVSSTIIPVFAHSCYRLDVKAIVRHPGTTGAVFDENWVRELRPFTVPRVRANVILHATFSTGGRHSIAILFYGMAKSSAILERVAVVHLADRTCS